MRLTRSSATRATDGPPGVLSGARPQPSRLRRAGRVVERVFAVSGLLFLVYHAGFDLSEVVSDSMAPALQGQGDGARNDLVLTERISTWFAPPPRFRILMARTAEGDVVAKRVVAYPGERVRVVDGALEVDGRLLGPAEGAPPVRYLRAGLLRPRPGASATHQVGPEAVFVLGDNQVDSWDSRFFGDLPRERWRGRVMAVVWPPERWEWLW